MLCNSEHESNVVGSVKSPDLGNRNVMWNALIENKEEGDILHISNKNNVGNMSIS